MAHNSSSKLKPMFDYCPECAAGGITPDKYGKCTNCGYNLVKEVLDETKPRDTGATYQKDGITSNQEFILHNTEMDTSKSIQIKFIAYYAYLLAALMVCGLLFSSSDQGDYTIRMPIRITAIAGMVILNIIAGFGLKQKSNRARLLLFVITPWTSIALGSAFAPALWTQDVPYTSILVFVYVPIVFMLTRPAVLKDVGAKHITWISRGGALLTAFCIITLLLYLSVSNANMRDSNTQVLLEVLFLLPFCHFLPALLVASIPTISKKVQDERVDITELSENSVSASISAERSSPFWTKKVIISLAVVVFIGVVILIVLVEHEETNTQTFSLFGSTERIEDIQITSELLTKLGFIRKEEHSAYKVFPNSTEGYLEIAGSHISGDYVIEDVRAGDIARELGFDLSDVFVPRGQPLGSKTRVITIPNWLIVLTAKQMDEERPTYGKDPDDICIVSMTQIDQSQRDVWRATAPPRYLIIKNK